MSRRFLHQRLIIALLAVALGLTAGCGASRPAESTVPPSPGTPPASVAGYPMQLTSPYGTTTLAKQPERVVVVGPEDVDTVLALGVVPVGAAGWGEYDDSDGNWPPYYGDTTVIKKTLKPIAGGADFEEVLKLKPDLIVAVGGIEDLGKGYDNLAKIAPVVTYPEKLESWSVGDPLVTARTIARPLGKQAEAEALIAKYQEKLAGVRTAHPEFEGKTISLVGFGGSPGVWLHSTKGSASEKFFEALGFKANPATATVSGLITEEKYSLIDTDVLVGFDNNGSTPESIKRLRNNPLFAGLSVVKNGAFLYLDEHKDLVFVGVPLSDPSLPGLIWLLDVLPDSLGKAAKAADDGKK